MKEFSNVREMVGQMELDLESKAGQVGRSFRINVRKELQKFCNEKNAVISIKQTESGSVVSMRVADGIDKEKSNLIKKEFQDLMERLGASSTGICTGQMPGALAILLSQGAV